ncbi:MAG: hypothetical protein E3K36_10815 [Candidatus Brocadia sp.]|nr:hypothetical protein [Candidatus Brocadia sp.]
MSTMDNDVLCTAKQDPVNISVYGNPVLDVIVDVSNTSRHLAERDAVQKVATIHSSGDLEFQPNTYLGFFFQGKPVVWGPFNLNNGQKVYSVGKKFPVFISMGSEAENLLKSCTVAILPGPVQRIGGGGPNVLFGFYDVFAKLRVELLATVEKPMPGGRAKLDVFVKQLTKKIGLYTPIPIYDWPGVNLCIEGLGPKSDRTIFTAMLPPPQVSPSALPMPSGRAIMVNTVYAPAVALDALAYACENERMGILALTKRLCSKDTVDKKVFEEVLANHPLMRREAGIEYASVHDFVIRYVLPHGGCICIMNEDEIQHLTGKSVCIERDSIFYPTLGRVVEVLREVRNLQMGKKDRFYVTLGADGSVVLDEHNELIYCGIVNDPNRQQQNKTAIGDTFATFILALETIGMYNRQYNIPAQDVIKAAAAGADSGVYDGFGNLTVDTVNYFLREKKRRLVGLGSLDSFPSKDWVDKPIAHLREVDWEPLISVNHAGEGYVPTTLQKVIGQAFLKLPVPEKEAGLGR